MAQPGHASAPDEELYRREAMGAFAHEVRTPLTSIRMVLELARREGTNGELVLDGELAGMLDASVDDLQQLADDLQEASRLERGRLVLNAGPCDLAAAVAAARELLPRDLELAGDVPEGIEGPWDIARLVRALAGFTVAANRGGNGSGNVTLAVEEGVETVRVTVTSGEAAGEARLIAADCGFSFFRSRLFVTAMGGAVDYDRRERYLSISLALPR